MASPPGKRDSCVGVLFTMGAFLVAGVLIVANLIRLVA